MINKLQKLEDALRETRDTGDTGGKGDTGTLCRKLQNKCAGHRSVPVNEQLSAPPPKAATGTQSGHEKSESIQ